MPLKAGNTDGIVTSAAIQALQWALLLNVKVSVNSYGGTAGGFLGIAALYDAIENARDAGHIFVAAAGNDGNDSDNPAAAFFPAAFDLENIISVAAVDNDEALAGISNFGATSVDLGAPGINVYSTSLGTSYVFLDGTSMAAPHVAGVVALVWSREPTLTWQEVRQRVLDSARPVDSLQCKTVTGGVVNAVAALGDCNVNGVDDGDDISLGTSLDCNANGKPDECEFDCDGNDIPDECDITAGTDNDCNANCFLDGCDISSGTSLDTNMNGIPDECECGACCVCFPMLVCHPNKTQSECQQLGGQFQGFGTKCVNIDCCTGPLGPQGP